MKKQFILLLDGMMGAGKTTVSKILADRIPRVAVIGMDKVKRFVSDFERGERDNGIARDIVLGMSKIYLEKGLSVIIEQPIKESEISDYESLANTFNIPIYKFQLYVDPEVSFSRVLERQRDREFKVPEERIRYNISIFKNKKDLNFNVIDTTKKDIEDVVNSIDSLMV